jgi:hypothetical protein
MENINNITDITPKQDDIINIEDMQSLAAKLNRQHSKQ